MNPYDINIEQLPESEEMTDEKDLLKLKIVSIFLKIIDNMETRQILEKTGLHKSDLSRLRTFDIGRFSIDRIIGLLDAVGFGTDIKVFPKKVS